LPRGKNRAAAVSAGHRGIAALTAGEVEEARLCWIRRIQALHLAKELEKIREGIPLARTAPLSKLNPFFDSQSLLRVGGRMRHAVLAFDERHPLILPGSSHFTKLTVEACHRRSLHGGVQMTLAMMRQRYWIPRGRALIKQLILRCVTCVRWRAAAAQQLMGNLPPERVRPARAFLHTGVDYAGPIMLRTTRGSVF